MGEGNETPLVANNYDYARQSCFSLCALRTPTKPGNKHIHSAATLCFWSTSKEASPSMVALTRCL